MRAGLRRTIGLGGAAFVAVGAALALTLPASAHQTVASVSCAGEGKTTVVINIHTTRDYSHDAQHPKNNKVWILDASGNTIFSDTFGASYSNNVAGTSLTPPIDGTKAENITVRAVGFDGQGDDSIPLTTPVCKETPPPPTTTTTAPPTTTTAVVAPTTTTKAPTTTTAVVAAASSQLPNTGVTAGMPLLIAGVLVVAGGGILLWLRIAAKRRSTNN